jgi:hypothetical protein
MSNNKAVVQKDRKGRLICTYDSIKHAAEATGVSWYGIRECLHKRQKTSAGFIWEYAPQIPKEPIYSRPATRKKELVLKPGETLCCHCDTCSPECSWKRCLKPVKGWEATPSRKNSSYVVTSCPLFTRTR